MSDQENTPNVEEDIKELVAEILEIELDEVKPEASFVKELGMDSMMALEILASIEKKYRVVIPEDSLPKFTDLNSTVEIVTEILNSK